MARRVRLDRELVDQGFFDTTDDAARAVMAGEVSARARRLEHPGEQVEPGCELHVRGHASYVSRGGLKLERALDEFGLDPTGLTCVDVGCSTGGFTDCLLRRGAVRVTSVDVGYAQFDWALRQDSRVELLERTNARDLVSIGRDGAYDFAVCDVSFTSVAAVGPAIAELLHDGGMLVVLVKPQFELARSRVGEGGVVRDAGDWADAIRQVASALEALDLAPQGCCPSPIAGAKGNREFLLYAIAGGTPVALDAVGIAASAE